MRRVLLVLGAVLALGACGEKEQTAGTVRQDTRAFQGTGMPYAAHGWKAGDQESWERQLKVRAQTTQNDYARID